MVLIKTYFKSILSVILLLGLAFVSNTFLGNDKYMLIALIGAIISIIPFFSFFENETTSTREIVVISVMIALCIAGRFIFAPIPHFKPVTALVIITGINFGSNPGFITGSLTALLSNMQHGQGPWTIFQMAVWGLIGFIAGFSRKIKLFNNKLFTYFYSAIAGIIYSLVMDIYTTISIDSSFSWSRYAMFVATSVPVMIEYIISNVVFMILLEKPIGKKLTRIKTKYGLFMQENTL